MQLSDEQFGKLTPRMFHALIKRWESSIERQELYAGIIASTIVNFSMAHPEKPCSPSDFMPSQVGKKEKQKQYSVTETKNHILAMFSGFKSAEN